MSVKEFANGTLLAVYHHGSRVNIGYPAAVGVAFGVANIMTKLGQLTTQVALHYLFPLTIRTNLGNMTSIILT